MKNHLSPFILLGRMKAEAMVIYKRKNAKYKRYIWGSVGHRNFTSAIKKYLYLHQSTAMLSQT